MELGVSLPHSQESTTCPYPSQINPFLCPSHFWQAQLVSFLVGLRTYQHPCRVLRNTVRTITTVLQWRIITTNSEVRLKDGITNAVASPLTILLPSKFPVTFEVLKAVLLKIRGLPSCQGMSLGRKLPMFQRRSHSFETSGNFLSQHTV